MAKQTSFASEHEGQRQALTLINLDSNQKLDHCAFSGESNLNTPSGLNAHGFFNMPSTPSLMLNRLDRSFP
jgi:hypothetical protein